MATKSRMMNPARARMGPFIVSPSPPRPPPRQPTRRAAQTRQMHRGARRDELFERMLGPDRKAQRASDQQEEGREDEDRSDESELLADRREDEVGLDGGDALRATEGESGPGHSAGTESKHRLDDLVTVPLCDWPGVEPHLEPDPHVSERLVAERTCDRG